MKAALHDKLGAAEHIYGLRFVDPTAGNKTAMVRNEEEWQSCWAVAQVFACIPICPHARSTLARPHIRTLTNTLASMGARADTLKHQAEKDRELEVDVIKLPPVKPYRLALKLDTDKKGKVEKKKIYYPNVYDEDVVFKIMVQGDAMAIKESTLAVPRKDKGALVLRFSPTETAKEETILVKLQGKEVYHVGGGAVISPQSTSVLLCDMPRCVQLGRGRLRDRAYCEGERDLELSLVYRDHLWYMLREEMLTDSLSVTDRRTNQ